MIKSYPCFLAFDLGAASGRAILGQLESDRLHTREIHRFTNAMIEVQGHLHWDFFHLLEEVKKGLAIAAQQGQVTSFAIDTWGVDFGLLDKEGNVLGLPFAYRDTRTQGAMNEFFRLIPKEKVYELTGVQFLAFNSLFQLFALKRDEPILLEQAKDLLFMPDLFYYLLTGEKQTEFTYATTSQLYNPRKKGWESALFEAMGVSPSLMQRIVQPGASVGYLNTKVIPRLAGSHIPAVAVATHDTASAVASVPARGEDWAFISSGTWSLMGIEVSEPIIGDLAFRLNFTNEGGAEGKFRFLKNITGLWLLQQCQDIWGQNKKISIARLITLAEKTSPFPFFIDPDWQGFLNPARMPEAIQHYCRRTEQDIPRTHAEFARGIFESLALKYRVVLDEIRRISPRPIRKIHVIGGGSKNRLLCQFTANATGLPVVAGPSEATSAGNIMIQAKSQGCMPSFDRMREVICDSFETEVYEPIQINEWENAYERYGKIIQTELDYE